jgi:hypothetical protein
VDDCDFALHVDVSREFFMINIITIKELKNDVNQCRVENWCFAIDCSDPTVIECYKEIVKH